MVTSTNFTYKCEICSKKFSHKNEAKAKNLATECETTHEVVYVPLLRSEVQRLLAFIVSKEDSLMDKSLYDKLRKYRVLK